MINLCYNITVEEVRIYYSESQENKTHMKVHKGENDMSKIIISFIVGVFLNLYSANFFRDFPAGVGTCFIISVWSYLLFKKAQEIKKNQELILEKINKEDDKPKEPEI